MDIRKPLFFMYSKISYKKKQWRPPSKKKKERKKKPKPEEQEGMKPLFFQNGTPGQAVKDDGAGLPASPIFRGAMKKNKRTGTGTVT
jgi:hypothetical protein